MLVYVICTLITIVLNLLMIFVFNKGEEISSNILIITISLMFFQLMRSKWEKIDKHNLKPERWAVLTIAGCSLLRFINRIETIYVSDTVNSLMFIIFFAAGLFILAASYTRYKKRTDKY